MKQQPLKKQPQVNTSKKVVSKSKAQDLLTSLDQFFDKYLNLFFWAGLFLTLLFSFLLFDFKVSDGGDDSAYIVRAYGLIHEGLFPSFQGPLYPFFLSIILAVTGVKVTLFKVFSLIFIGAQFVFLFKAFAKRIPSTLLVTMLMIISVCSTLLYFASQTYSEAFFMFIQSVLIFYVFKFIIDRWDEPVNLKTDWSKYLILGLLTTAAYYARNVGLTAIIALIGFFIVNMRWKQAVYTFGGFLMTIVPLEILKRVIWDGQLVQFSDQGKTLLLKDAYTPAKGTEDFMGFIHRYIDNANIYISKHFFIFAGLKSDVMPVITPILTVLVLALVVLALVMTYRKNRYIFFTTLYTFGIASVTFFAVQAHWDQPRLSIVFYPLLVLAVFSGLYYLLSLKFKRYERFFTYLVLFLFIFIMVYLKIYLVLIIVGTSLVFSLLKSSIQIIYPSLFLLIFLSSSLNVITKTNEHSKTLQANLSGNMYYGMTPDWVNYIEMSKYVAKKVPKNELTACRKPEISFVYSGANFYGIYTIPTVDIDTFNLSLKVPPTTKIVGLNLLSVNNDMNVNMAHAKLRKYTYAFINANLLDENRTAKESKVIGVYKVPTAVADTLLTAIQGPGVEFVEDIPAVLDKIHKDNWSYAIQDPEAMLNTLKENNVRYAILASLRKVPQYNTGEIISTIHRFVYFIQLKYPNLVQEVHKIGDTEPATLLKFNY